MGYKPLSEDPCIYVLVENGFIVSLFAVYVDDFVIGSDTESRELWIIRNHLPLPYPILCPQTMTCPLILSCQRGIGYDEIMQQENERGAASVTVLELEFGSIV